jgi:hypothetical protein
MRKLKSLIILLTFLIVVLLSGDVISQKIPDKKLWQVKVENSTECLIAFVSIVRIEFFPGTKKLKQMHLWWASWLEPQEKGFVYMREGEYYAMYAEGWNYDLDTKQPTTRVGSGYVEGPYIPDKSGDEVIIRGDCKGQQPRFDI